MVRIEIATSLTNGGRSLNAIWENRKLNTQEKAFLLYLSARADFTGTFTEKRFESLARICAATGLSRSQALNVARRLEEGKSDKGAEVAHGGGYIKREQRKRDKLNLPSYYAITNKLFEEYAAILEGQMPAAGVVRNADQGGGGVVRNADGGSPHCGRGVVRNADPSSLLPSSLSSSLISPLTPPEGGTAVKNGLGVRARIRRRQACSTCAGAGEVAIRRRCDDGQEERTVAACTCSARSGGIWSLADAAKCGWQVVPISAILTVAEPAGSAGIGV